MIDWPKLKCPVFSDHYFADVVSVYFATGSLLSLLDELVRFLSEFISTWDVHIGPFGEGEGADSSVLSTFDRIRHQLRQSSYITRVQQCSAAVAANCQNHATVNKSTHRAQTMTDVSLFPIDLHRIIRLLIFVRNWQFLRENSICDNDW